LREGRLGAARAPLTLNRPDKASSTPGAENPAAPFSAPDPTFPRPLFHPLPLVFLDSSDLRAQDKP